jgi:carbon monoxide dehydrogenase subunit G
MIKVARRSLIEHATPEEIFAALSDPNGLTQLLPRVKKVEMLQRTDTRARLVTHMAMGGMFGNIRCEGDLTWTEPREIVFVVRKPLPVETRWQLFAAPTGTEIQASMALDLAPMLGPMASFVPTEQVTDMLTREIEDTIKALRVRVSEKNLRERAIAA